MSLSDMLGRSETAVDEARPETVAAAYLTHLAARGIEHLFGNAGTDFAPILDAYAWAGETGAAVPAPILAGHENLAVSMAHGYAMVSRRVPAVMVHVSVGTANMVCPALNAARENVAMLLTAGRTPVFEKGVAGARDGFIHWGQEMFDQAGMIREAVKWDYELRGAEQVGLVVDRALAIAASEPRGPVYLSLPREVLAAGAVSAERGPAPAKAAPALPDTGQIGRAAEILTAAAQPLIVATNAGREAGGFEAVSRFAKKFAIPVVQHRPRYLALPDAHGMNLGYEPHALLAEADAVMVLESDVPWIPARAEPRAGAAVIQCGQDPLYRRLPIRGFASDLTLAGSTAGILAALEAAMGRPVRDEARRADISMRRARERAWRENALVAAAEARPIDPVWASHCIGRAKDADAVLVNEYPLLLNFCAFEEPDCYFGSSSASGLGWGAGAALGAKLARPDRQVIATLGDGAFMFANPAAVHQAAALHGLPVLFVIFNNAMWGAVKRSALSLYPQRAGSALPFTGLGAPVAFEAICAAAGGHGERVEDPAALPDALERGLAAVRGGQQALINVMTAPA